MIEYVEFISDGWVALWCPKYNYAEMAFQIVAGTQIADFSLFFSQPYHNLRGRNHETMLPFTHLEKNFVGDRYGDSDLEIPRDADYAAQVKSEKNGTHIIGGSARTKF